MKIYLRISSAAILVVVMVTVGTCFCPACIPYKQIKDTIPKSIPWNFSELSKCPDFEWGDGTTVRSLYYKSESYNGATTRVFAYYATPGTLSGNPSMDKKLPAIVLVHGGGGTAFPQWVQLWASRGYAAIAMDLAGCDGNNVKMPDGGPGQGNDAKFSAIEKGITEQWPYHAVANVIRAHSLIRSFPEVDSNRVALTGISWGGYLTCIVAGIDNRFKAAVPVYGCGFLYENSVWLNEFAKMSVESKNKWIQLWEPSMYVGKTTMPIFFVNGGTDFAFPPDSHAKTYSLVRSPKNIHFVPCLLHGHYFDQPKEIEAFVKQYLCEGTPLPKIVSTVTEEKQITANFHSKTSVVKAELYYTVDPLSVNSKNRKWLKLPATITQNTITSDLPPKNTKIWFLTLVDDLNMVISSELVFPSSINHITD